MLSYETPQAAIGVLNPEIRESRNSRGDAEVLKKMLDFNKKHPTAAITPDTIDNSMAQHMKTSAEMYHGITINKSLRPELMRNIREYDDEDEE